MKYYFTIVFLFTVLFTSNTNYISGGYYERVYLADSLFLSGDVQNSNNILTELFNEFKPINLKYYEEFKTYVKSDFLLGRVKKAKVGFERLISEYGLTMSQINNDDIFSELFDREKFSSEDYDLLREIYLNTTHQHLQDEIVNIKTLDSKYRSSREVYKKNRKTQDSIDKKNALRLKEIFESYGYPRINRLGLSEDMKSRDYDILIPLLHTSDSIRKVYFLPKILDFIRKGECNPIVYAFLFDQMRLYNNLPQKYGSYNSSNIHSFDSLNKFRKEIGLPKHGYEKWRRSVM